MKKLVTAYVMVGNPKKWFSGICLLGVYILLSVQASAQWVQVGEPIRSTQTVAATANSNYQKIAVSSTGVPYMLFANSALSNKATVRKYDGSDWVSVGTEGFSIGAVGATDMRLDNTGTPYVCFSDAGNVNRPRVMKFNGTSWVNVGSTPVSPNVSGDLSLKIYNNVPYVCFLDSIRSNKVSVSKFNGTSWVNVGNPGFTSTTCSNIAMDIDGSGNVYVAYKSGIGVNNGVSVAKFNGTSWSTVGGLNIQLQPAGFDIAVDANGVPYVIAEGGTGGTVYKYNGSAWVVVGATIATGAYCLGSSILTIGTTPYIAFTHFSSYKVYVRQFDGTAWANVGGGVAINDFYSLCNLVKDASGNLFVGGRQNPTYKGNVYRYCSSFPTLSMSNQTICGPAFTTIAPTFSNGVVKWYRPGSFYPYTISSSIVTNTLTSNSIFYALAEDFGCSSPLATMTVVVKTTPVVTSATANPNPVCGSGTTTLTGAANLGTISWYLTQSGGFSQGSGNSLTVSVTGARNYYAEALYNGCKSIPRSLVGITVQPRPTVSNAIAGSRCGPGTVSLSATPSSGSTLLWYPVSIGGTAISTGSSFVTPSISATTPYFIESAVGTCKSSRSTIFATINPSVTPTVAISGSQTTICAGTSVTFTSTLTNGGTLPGYQWKLNGNPISGGNASSYTSSTLTNGSVISLVITSSDPCASISSATSNGVNISVTTSVTPSVTVSTSQTVNCPGANVTLTATSLNGGTNPSYQWKLNGNPISGANASTYATSTWVNGSQYSVVMTSNNSCASPTTATSTNITLTNAPSVTPTISISGSSTVICAGSNVTFTSTITNGGTVPTYQWKLNGNNISGANSASYSSTSLTNNAQISCLMTSNNACASPSTGLSNIVTLTVGGSVVPAVTISASLSTICGGTSVTFSANATNGGAAPVYQWKLNGASVGTNSSTYTNANLANGAVVSCQLVSNNPCASPSIATSNSIPMTVIANVTPAITVVPSQTNICSGANVTFNANISNYGTVATYRWRLNGATISGATSSSYSSTTLANNDVISCVLIGNPTCGITTATSNSITMSSVGNSTPTITIAPSQTSLCTGVTVTFTSTVTNAGPSPTYSWKVNGAPVGTNSPSFSTSTLADSNTVSCVMTSNATCLTTSIATSNGVLMSLGSTVTPSISISASSTVLCSGESVTFDATTSNQGTNPLFQWKLNGSPIPDANGISFTSANLSNGSLISCQVTSSDACASPASVTSSQISITVNQTPSNLVTINGNTLTAVENGAVYYWGDCIAQAGIPDANSQSYTAQVPGQYIVLVEKNGCKDTSTCYTISNIIVTGNDDHGSIENSLSVYPNPSFGEFTIEYNGTSDIEIRNGYGQIVSEIKSGKDKIHTLSDLADGIYFVRTELGSKVVTKKVIVTK